MLAKIRVLETICKNSLTYFISDNVLNILFSQIFSDLKENDSSHLIFLSFLRREIAATKQLPPFQEPTSNLVIRLEALSSLE